MILADVSLGWWIVGPFFIVLFIALIGMIGDGPMPDVPWPEEVDEDA